MLSFPEIYSERRTVFRITKVSCVLHLIDITINCLSILRVRPVCRGMSRCSLYFGLFKRSVPLGRRRCWAFFRCFVFHRKLYLVSPFCKLWRGLFMYALLTILVSECIFLEFTGVLWASLGRLCKRYVLSTNIKIPVSNWYEDFCQVIRELVNSPLQWQIITLFNYDLLDLMTFSTIIYSETILALKTFSWWILWQ